MIVKVAVTLLGTAIISYLLIPAVSDLALWQSTGIFLCLNVMFIGLEIRRNAGIQQSTYALSDPNVNGQLSLDVDPFVAETAAMIEQIKAVAQPQRSAVEHPPARKTIPIQKMNFYEAEALVLTELLQQQHGQNVRVTTDGMVKAPRFIGYRVNQIGALQFKKLAATELDLAREINDVHRNFSFGSVNINFTETQPIWLQISNPKPFKLLWSSRHDNWRPKPLQAMLGYYYEGVTAKPLIIDIKGKDSSHVNGAFFGQPGAGKSRMMQAALDGMFEFTPPTELRAWGIDLSNNAFAPYIGLPHFEAACSDIHEAMKILQMFANWCEAETAPTDGVHRLLVIDEFQDLLTHNDYGKTALKLMDDILSKGRKFGIRVWMATQNPSAKSYPADLKPKTHFMCCGFILNDDYVSSELKIKGASKITEKEEMIIVTPTGTHRTSLMFYPDDEQAAMLKGLIGRWNNQTVTVAPSPAVVTPSSFVASQEPPVSIENTPANGLGPNERWNLPNRAPTPGEAKIIVDMVRNADPATELFHWRGEVSKNKVMFHVYGSKGIDKSKWIGEILEEAGLL